MLGIRAIEVVWLLFLGGLAAVGLTTEQHSPYEWLVLLALGGVQMAESRLDISSDKTSAALAIGVKLSLCYWLVAETGAIESSYYLIFLLPIVSAASLFGLGETLLITLISSGLYLSFLLYVDYERYELDTGAIPELTVRVLFFFLSAILVNRLAIENRLKTESLARANRDLVQAQAEVRRSERLAALGQLSAGLAHELRNPLGVISASAELLGKHVESENEVAREVAGYIRTEVERSNVLVTHFLDFARPSAPRRQMHDLNVVVERALGQLLESTKDGKNSVEIRRDLQQLPRFSFDATLIESAVFNLLINGYEAMESGGTLRVSTGRKGNMARIEISDTGAGIPAEQLESVFNPFFTTKPRGVGLGLAVVSKFIDSHDGNITVQSEAGRGSTFRILLPLGTQA